MNKIKVTTSDNQKIKKSTEQYIDNILNSANKSDIKSDVKSDVKKELLSDIELNKLENKIKNQQNKDNYKRPEITYTDKLSKSQIKELLIDYERVKDVKELEKIPPGTHLRYFEMKNKELKFRTGGVLTVNSGLPDYIILSKYDKLLFKNDATIKGQQALLSEQTTKIKELLKEIKRLNGVNNNK